jgi:hypothetical protein
MVLELRPSIPLRTLQIRDSGEGLLWSSRSTLDQIPLREILLLEKNLG